jgi:hypothetical protein
MSTTPFSQAVQAIITGDEDLLTQLLRAQPALVRERAVAPHQATLLHYLGANGVEDELQVSAKNAPALARILLEAGAEADALAPIYRVPSTTMCLLVTSVHPWRAGVQAELVDALVDHGAKVDGVRADGEPLGCALLTGYTRAAERLVIRGARVENVIYAAGMGRTDVVRNMLSTRSGTEGILRRTDDWASQFSFPLPRDADANELALVVAAIHDRVATVRALLDGGIGVNVAPFCGQTALHFAAHLGCAAVVDELLARGADTSVIDLRRNKTAAQWAFDGGFPAIAMRIRRYEAHARGTA